MADAKIESPSSETSPADLEIREGMAWITLDAPGKPVNTLSRDLMVWFEETLKELEDSGLGGLVIRSGKPGTFIAGADIDELQELEDPGEVRDLLKKGHALLRQMSGLPFPVVSAIHGTCLGGGLELALAGDWRVATEDRRTRLGLPEVQLGLIPGLGGTQRLPRLIGVPKALDLILTGKRVRPGKARRIGLVDELCHPADLEEGVQRMARRGKRDEGKSWGRQGLADKAGDLMARTPLADRVVYDKAREKVLSKTSGHYPAPLTAIDVVRRGLGESLERGSRSSRRPSSSSWCRTSRST
ncbi:MAG: enoyl-CoA hydratase-related protein [Thermoanaerobaculia bacterium]|nr:enoyl-CoA hydratase-related protein [Thermoanaerobaculia bacterium]